MSSLPQHPPSQGVAGPSSHPPGGYPGESHLAQGHHRSDSYIRPGPIHDFPPSYQGYLPPGPLPSNHLNNFPLPPPPQPRKASRTQTGDSGALPPTSTSGPSKKRARTSQSAHSPPPSATIKPKPDIPIAQDPPAVLLREKKQKACANCRKAKLKCIVGEDQSECVRCLARKEKCVFYPRTQDEDWQQTMTQDVYSAMSHLSDLSSAVHHLIYHLSNQGVIPGFLTSRGTALDRYEAPERDLPMMQGWDAEKNREAGTAAKRGRGTREETEDDEKVDSQQIPTLPAPAPLPQPTDQGQLQQSRPLSGSWYIPEEPDILSDGMIPGPSSSTSHPTPNLPIGTDYTPPSDQHIDRSYNSPMAYNSTSPGLPLLHNQPHPPQFMPPNPRSGSSAFTQRDSAYSGMLVSPGCILGCNDPREDVITDGMVAPEDAIVLVNHCHERLSPFLFGFQLEFGHFPYLPGGPTLITPLILAVHCLLASERIPGLLHYHTRLADAVKTLIVDSPAGSWRTLRNVQDDIADGLVIYGEDDLDPEVGIGPEEIVAAALLSLWLSSQDSARDFARLAFQYARGWIKIMSTPAPRSTIAETMGMVTQERVTTEQERARVWLLCYLADGIVTSLDTSPSEPIRNPHDYCIQLIPHPLPTFTAHLDHHDLVLSSHAGLLHLFHDWHSKFNASMIPGQSSSSFPLPEIQRFTAATDFQVDDIRCSVLSIVPSHWVSAKALNLFGLFVRTTISSKLVHLPTVSSRQRVMYVARMVDVGLEMLEMCAAWSPASTIADLPQQYLAMIGVVAHIVKRSVEEAVNTNAPTGCSVSPREVSDLLETLIRTLTTNSGLPEGHNIWVCVNACTRLAAQLKGMCA